LELFPPPAVSPPPRWAVLQNLQSLLRSSRIAGRPDSFGPLEWPTRRWRRPHPAASERTILARSSACRRRVAISSGRASLHSIGVWTVAFECALQCAVSCHITTITVGTQPAIVSGRCQPISADSGDHIANKKGASRNVAEKEKTERRVYVLPLEQLERIRAYQTAHGIGSEVEAVRRLLDAALQMRDDIYDVLKTLKSRYSADKDLRILVRDILATHTLVQSVRYEEGAVCFYLTNGMGEELANMAKPIPKPPTKTTTDGPNGLSQRKPPPQRKAVHHGTRPKVV